MTAPYKVTPLHHWHQQHNARMDTVNEWRCVLSYGDSKAEMEAGRSAVAIGDVTPLAKINVQGERSEELLGKTSDRRIPKVGHCLPIMPSRYDRIPTHLARLTHDRFLLLADPADRVGLYSSMEAAAKSAGCAHVSDLTSSFAAMLLLGPKSPELLKKLGSANVEGIPVDGCVQTSIARVWSFLVRWNIGETPGWLLLLARDYGEYVWECTLSAGLELGILPFGIEAQRAVTRRGTH
jgi:glycine cleavage system aminomethyltransferase T